MPQGRSGHIVELQSLRGIAATSVMVGHVLVYYKTPDWFLPFAVIFNGRAAVVIFFVLSGYVLTLSLRTALFDRESVLRFYVQRLFRIYPAVWAASSLSLFYIFTLHWQIPVAGADIRTFRADRFDTLHIVASLAGMTTFILPQLWTIFVELVASAAIPGIAFIVQYRRGWYPYLLGASLLVSFTIPNTYYHVTMYFLDFVVGAGLTFPGFATKAVGNVRPYWPVPIRPILSFCLIGLALTLFLPLPYYSPAAHLLETILAATTILLLIGAKERAELPGYDFAPLRLLNLRALLLLGDISYSLYLLHYPVLCITAKVFAVLQKAVGIDVDVITLSILLAVATCATTIPLAWLCYTYVERPGIKLGKLSLTQMKWASAR
jgi:peptidoglycan/LPS O-acetylase OafA/YrhL